MGIDRGQDGPRQPRTVQKLLDWATEIQNGAPSEIAPMDPDRARWLEDALRSVTVDELEQIKNALNIISRPEEPADALIDALEALQGFVENLDNANDLQLIGGWPVVSRLLSHSDGGVRSRAAEVIATSVQNYPVAQEFALRNGSLTALTALLADSDATCRKKALLGISSLVREFVPGQEAWIAMDGPASLLQLIQDGDEQVRVKALFLLRHVCDFHPAIADRVKQAGLLSSLVTSTESSFSTLREQALGALVSLADASSSVVAECRRAELRIAEKLSTQLSDLESLPADEKEAREEELRYLQRLRELFA